MAEYQIISTRIHPDISNKLSIWKQIEDSYVGGRQYTTASPNYLYQNPKESDDSYAARKNRAVYFNQISPLIDMLVGFIYAQKPKRENINAVQYMIDNAYRNKSFDQFIQMLARYSLMFTCGVLVDSPQFDSDAVQTARDRQDYGLNPFCVLYKPSSIRDFATDDNGNLIWILLDNTYIDKVDPYKDAVNVCQYRLWEIGKYTDFSIASGSATLIGQQEYSLPYIPFRFVNWRDDNQDFVAESICEDLALIAQAIYNNISYMDEMIAAGSFRMLMYPTPDGQLPAELRAGVGPLSIIPYPAGGTQKPFFDGATLQDIAPFISALEFYMTELLKKIGLDTDEAKTFVKSGIAKKLDFEKVKTLLVAGAAALEQTEKWIFDTALAWEGISDSGIKVRYEKDFLGQDVDEKLTRYAMLLTAPYKSMQKAIYKLMAQVGLSNDIDTETMNKIIDEIDTSDDELNIDDLANQQSNADGMDTPVDVEAEAKARLKGTVGGVQGVLEIQRSVTEGITDYDAAINLLMEIYGYSKQTAISILGDRGVLEKKLKSKQEAANAMRTNFAQGAKQ